MMTGRTETEFHGTYSEGASFGVVKFLRDVWSVLEIKLLFLLRGWYWYAIRPLVFPLGVLFWLRVMVPDDPDINSRILSGAVVFGVALSIGHQLSQQILVDRFVGRLKLLITMPMSKASYTSAILAFAAIQAIPIVVILLAFSSVVGVDLELTWAFFPLMAAAVFGIAGIAVMIASYAPSVEAGGIMSNLYGVVLVMISPVFFTMDQAPAVLKIVGWVSPMRYAADGVMKSLSGGTDVWLEFLILAGFAAATMGLGLWKLRWRES